MLDAELLRVRALAAIQAVAADHGLPIEPLEVLSDQGNLLVLLPAVGLVVRAATTVATVRPVGGFANQLREVTIARHLLAAGVPVVPPAEGALAGPHRVEGMSLSFWQRVDEDPARPLDAAEAGRRLRALHDALAGADLPGIPAFEPLSEVDRLLDLMEAEAAIAPADLATLRAARLAHTPIWAAFAMAPSQILHGDAHLSNLLRTPTGPVWHDFEDTVRAPLAWDLACMVGASRTWGPPDPAAEAALAAWGPEPGALQAMIPLRALLVVCWVAYMAHRHPSPASQARAEARLAWWRRYQAEA